MGELLRKKTLHQGRPTSSQVKSGRSEIGCYLSYVTIFPQEKSIHGARGHPTYVTTHGVEKLVLSFEVKWNSHFVVKVERVRRSSLSVLLKPVCVHKRRDTNVTPQLSRQI
jgi:hypothetical protein